MSKALTVDRECRLCSQLEQWRPSLAVRRILRLVSRHGLRLTL